MTFGIAMSFDCLFAFGQACRWRLSKECP